MPLDIDENAALFEALQKETNAIIVKVNAAVEAGRIGDQNTAQVISAEVKVMLEAIPAKYAPLPKAPEQPEPEPPPVADADEQAGGTEAAVQLAEENDIDINTVKGTGVDGRVTVPDVRAAIAAKKDAENK